MYWWFNRKINIKKQKWTLIKTAKKTKKTKKAAEPIPVTEIKTNPNLIYKFPNYIKLKEFKTNNEVIINTRRILCVKQVNSQKSLFVMNSGYKIFISISLENLWANYLLKQPFKV